MIRCRLNLIIPHPLFYALILPLSEKPGLFVKEHFLAAIGFQAVVLISLLHFD
jgi:hypothetical protein